MLTWLEVYTGALDGIYSDVVIVSVYQYQLVNAILTEQDSVNLRGYLGPSTRTVLNASYVEYQLEQIYHVAELWLSSCDKKDVECRKQELENTLRDKGYRLTAKGLVQMAKEALV
jgi:hypothetical protein